MCSFEFLQDYLPFVVLLLLQLADVVFTKIGLDGDKYEEVNPLLHVIPFKCIVAAKIFVPIGLLALHVHQPQPQYILWLLNGVVALVIIWNCGVLLYFKRM